MRILLPYDIKTTRQSNPYLFLLMRELCHMDEVDLVQSGYGWLYEVGEWDIIHLHWPELLVKSQLADMSRIDLLKEWHFEKVTASLRRKKTDGAKIITTVHNEKPHKDASGQFENFYSEIYDLSDGFIHMGNFSKEMLLEDYSEESKSKLHAVIPHGSYNYFPSGLKRSECREKLKIQENEKLILTFGAVRSKKELELGIDAFNRADIGHSMYLIAGSIPHPYRSQPEHFIVRKKLYTNIFNDRIKTHEKTIAPDEVQIYLKAADLVFIPRFNTLNSGNIALGFTFGKVVIGPDYGVIGEILNQTGNPVFDPTHLQSVSNAISKGCELAEGGHGIKNKEYANHHMNWDRIAIETLKAYQSL